MRLFVLGGARSGKSAYAVGRAKELGGDGVTFIATARPGDAELALRIADHRRHRPRSWPTIEAGEDLAAAILRSDPAHVLLIDSLTLWLSLIIEREDGAARWAAADGALARRAGAAIIVSDEIGLGMVPLDPLSRRYRDALGRIHQAVAASADEVVLMVAGLPLEVKK